LHEDVPIVPLSRNVQLPCQWPILHGARVEQYDIGNTKLIGISVIIAIVTGMITLVEIAPLMISVLNGLAKEMITFVEIALPMISVLRSLATEMIMLVETFLPMVRANLSPLPLAGIVVIMYPYPDTLMIVVMRMKHQ